jgi:hypothetical protein
MLFYTVCTYFVKFFFFFVERPVHVMELKQLNNEIVVISVVDPDSLNPNINPDPAFLVNTDPDTDPVLHPETGV